MFCRNCGTEAGESRFCPECGSEIQAANYAPVNGGEVESFNLITAYISMFKKYADFSGRSRRCEYRLASIANYIVILIMYIIMAVFAVPSAVHGSYAMSAGTIIIGLLMFVYALAILVPSLAMEVRRMHDIGRSGWILLLGLIPYVGALIIFIFSLCDSQIGPNQYGPNPKGRN